MEILHLTEETFDETISEGTVLVDFWATWCGPCRMLAPTIEKLAQERDDVQVCKVDVDEQPSLAARFGVMSIPTVIIFKDGEEYEKLVGLRPIESYKEVLEETAL